MISIYDKNIDGDKVKVFISLRNGAAHSTTLGNNAVSKVAGVQFYVDEYVSVQLDKTEFYMNGLQPKLKIKDGEELIIPEKSEKEKEIERLRKELERLENAE